MRNFCEKCGKKVDLQTGLCPDCDAEKIERAAKRREKGPRRIRLGVVILLLLITACAAYLRGIYDAVIYGDICQHEWRDATCTAPKTCELCGEIEGEPLAHDWLEATCTMMQRCAVCQQVKGVPLGHTPGRMMETYDFLRAVINQEQRCTVCDSLITGGNQKLDTFSKDNMFLFTPAEFMERMKYIAEEYYPDFSYEFISQSGGDVALVSWGEESNAEFQISFYKSDSSLIMMADFTSEPVWCISLGTWGKPKDLGALVKGDMLHIWYDVCDPEMDDDIRQRLIATKLASFANAVEFGEPCGYAEENGLLYEFGHLKYNEEIGLEAIMVYANNWKW